MALASVGLTSCALAYGYGDYVDVSPGAGGAAGASSSSVSTGALAGSSGAQGGSGGAGGCLAVGAEVCLNGIDEDCDGHRCAEPLFAARYGDAEAQSLEAIAHGPSGADGDALLAGAFVGLLDLGGGKHATRDAALGPAAFVASVGADGTPRWIRPRPGGTGTAAAVVAGTLVGVVAAGAFEDGTTGAGADAWVQGFGADDGATSWVLSFGGAGDDRATAVAVDGGGVLFVAATATADLTVGAHPVTIGGGTDAVVAQLVEGSGTVLWAKAFGGAGRDVATALAANAVGEVFVAGSYEGVTNVPTLPDAGVHGDPYVMKLDALGAVVWAKGLLSGADASDGSAAAVALHPSGDVIVVGTVAGPVDFAGDGSQVLGGAGGEDAFVARYDGAGLLLWARRYGDAADQQAHGVAVDAAGNVLVSGSFEGRIDFAPGAPGGALTSAGGVDLFLAKLDANGGLVFCGSFGKTATEARARALVTAFADGVALGGSSDGAVDFGAPSGLLPPHGDLDVLLARFGGQ